ncbi:MAG TPA: lysylphosphatidylglycerol synthase transmembrane domain-containing protein [Candidatus Angelobacter sp.]|nr:lysylphosphatidylglycerol synthase transmembrane domain-containing protein [Candidatus Angelobacter sp.]
MVITAVVLLALAALVYLQVNTWKKFDWHTFKEQTEDVNLLYIGLGVAIIYFDYYLRALRWKILLRPVCQTTGGRLLAPTMVGFTAMALLGRPGEFIRPFLIAKRERLTMSSQLAVWVVERIFDVGAFALIMAINIMLSPSLRDLPGFAEGATKRIARHDFTAFSIFQFSGFALLAGVVLAAVVAVRARRNPQRIARVFQRLFSVISKGAGEGAYHRVVKFGEGLNTIHDAKSFVQISIISLLLWGTIGATYVLVTHAYSEIGPDMTLASAFLLTGASVAGGILQLPVVGGGSQLATIGTLVGVFELPKELAISCGIMLWLVTFMSVIPAGLILAHFERISLTKLEKESLAEEEKALENEGEQPEQPEPPEPPESP